MRTKLLAEEEIKQHIQSSKIGRDIETYINTKERSFKGGKDSQSYKNLIRALNRLLRAYNSTTDKPFSTFSESDLNVLCKELKSHVVKEEVLDGSLKKGEPMFRTLMQHLRDLLFFFSGKYKWDPNRIKTLIGRAYIPPPLYQSLSESEINLIYSTIERTDVCRAVARSINRRLQYHSELTIAHPAGFDIDGISPAESQNLLKAIFALAFKARLRAFEICLLKIGAIDYDTGEGKIIGKGREREPDSFYIFPKGLEDIKGYLNNRIENKTEFMFPCLVIEKIERRSIKYRHDYTMFWNIWNIIRKESSVNFNMRRMGHAGITWMDRHGYSPGECRDWARHRSLKTTTRYIDKGGSELREKIQKDLRE